MSRVWNVGGFALGLSRRASASTVVDVDHPDSGGACTPEAASRLSDVLRQLGMLAITVDADRESVRYWTGRLDDIERRDREAAVS